jgi:nicotinate-nucleotide adenylyltransferase
MSRIPALGLFGGTYDPIHLGHLRTALEVRMQLELDEIRLLPWRSHSLREQPSVGGDLRLELVRAAIQELPGFTVDERAFWREGTAYTFDIMSELRAENPEASLCMISGMDAFARMEKWYRWREIFELVNVVVVTRPGATEPTCGALGDVLAQRRVQTPEEVHRSKAGSIYVLTVTQLGISATALRASIAAGLDPRFLVPDGVRRLILSSGAYKR